MIQVCHRLRLHLSFTLDDGLAACCIVNLIDEAADVDGVLESARLVRELNGPVGAGGLASTRQTLAAVQVNLGTGQR